MTSLKNCLLALVLLVGVLYVIQPSTAHAQITLKDFSGCAAVCDPVMLQEEHQACLTKDKLNACLAEKEACKEWSAEFKTGVVNFCDAYGERMCGCGEQALKPVSPSAPAKVKRPKPPSETGKWKPEGSPRVKERSEEDGCVARNGVWVKIIEERCEMQGDKEVCQDYATHQCFRIEDAYRDIEWLKKQIAEGAKITKDVIRRLEVLEGMDFTKGFSKYHGWEQERDKIVVALNAICFLSSEDEAALRAELKDGEEVTLVARCEAVRAKIDANEKRSKEAVKKADEAKDTADEAKDLAEDAIKLSMPSYLRLSAVGGLHFVRTPRYNDTGNDFVGFGGVEAQWWHPITPSVALSLEGGLGYSTTIYDSNSVTTWLGVGLGTELGKDVLGSVHLYASHFFSDEEWSKLNTYGLAPEFSWTPGLSEKKPGGVVPVLTLRVPFGMTRTSIEGLGVSQDPYIGGVLGLGILF